MSDEATSRPMLKHTLRKIQTLSPDNPFSYPSTPAKQSSLNTNSYADQNNISVGEFIEEGAQLEYKYDFSFDKKPSLITSVKPSLNGSNVGFNKIKTSQWSTSRKKITKTNDHVVPKISSFSKKIGNLKDGNDLT